MVASNFVGYEYKPRSELTKVSKYKPTLNLCSFLLGPATYNPVLLKSSAIISFCKGSKRFGHFRQEFSPGPTTYEVCQLFLLALT